MFNLKIHDRQSREDYQLYYQTVFCKVPEKSARKFLTLIFEDILKYFKPSYPPIIEIKRWLKDPQYVFNVAANSLSMGLRGCTKVPLTYLDYFAIAVAEIDFWDYKLFYSTIQKHTRYAKYVLSKPTKDNKYTKKFKEVILTEPKDVIEIFLNDYIQEHSLQNYLEDFKIWLKKLWEGEITDLAEFIIFQREELTLYLK